MRGSITLVLACLALACATSTGEDRDARERRMLEANSLAAALVAQRLPAPEPGEVRVRLAFGAAADLDLYVTGPSYETVYYANSPSRSGDVLDEDLRCDAPAPRIETVRFRAAAPGAYRVGVDFPEQCDGKRRPTPFVVFVETAAGRHERRQTIRPGEFLLVVLSTVLEP